MGLPGSPALSLSGGEGGREGISTPKKLSQHRFFFLSLLPKQYSIQLGTKYYVVLDIRGNPT